MNRSPIRRYFDFGHLPEGPLRETSSIFYFVAHALDQRLPDGAEKSTALRKLLEAKDAAVRAALDLPVDGMGGRRPVARAAVTCTACNVAGPVHELDCPTLNKAPDDE